MTETEHLQDFFGSPGIPYVCSRETGESSRQPSKSHSLLFTVKASNICALGMNLPRLNTDLTWKKLTPHQNDQELEFADADGCLRFSQLARHKPPLSRCLDKYVSRYYMRPPKSHFSSASFSGLSALKLRLRSAYAPLRTDRLRNVQRSSTSATFSLANPS